jgi:nitroimidazol reductase NimA-like FMN-containing flavoprotein (pyridoxamine 5'-phosphate oxidase superfamily)
MKKTLLMAAALLIPASFLSAYAEDPSWTQGGPDYLYVKPLTKPKHHGVFDEGMKCLECHRYDGVDAYTSATMSLKKTIKGHAPRALVEQEILAALRGKGDYREIYVMATSFDNKPMATVIEFVVDPETMNFYAMSEKQTEKLFHIAANPNVSLAYVKQREDYDYFSGALGVQVMGRAVQLKGTDPEFEAAAAIYIPTLPLPQPNPMIPQPPSLDILIEMVRSTKIITKIIPDRIAIMKREFKGKGYHAMQIWEPQTDKQKGKQ